nr:MAG TPA: Elicitor peptide 1-7 [Caudoviricetes sp.]
MACVFCPQTVPKFLKCLICLLLMVRTESD